MDYTRAAEITRNVRSLITQSVSRPIVRAQGDALYQFYYPGTTLSLTPQQYMDRYEGGEGTGTALNKDTGGLPHQNSVFFRLPTEPFNATASNWADNERMVTRLPSGGFHDGGRAKVDPGTRVFMFMPSMLRRAGALDGLDADDRHSYQFDLQIRRSVLRAGVEDARGTGRKQPLDDLFVVHIRIYKGYDFDSPDAVAPFFEWAFNVSATRAGETQGTTR
jgi:hypothetical protein